MGMAIRIAAGMTRTKKELLRLAIAGLSGIHGLFLFSVAGRGRAMRLLEAFILVFALLGVLAGPAPAGSPQGPLVDGRAHVGR
jgi:hypothetical protein